jgi:hypothetical protein
MVGRSGNDGKDFKGFSFHISYKKNIEVETM